MHTPENPVWGIDGYGYLATINNLGLKTRCWPKKPTIYTQSPTSIIDIGDMCHSQLGEQVRLNGILN